MAFRDQKLVCEECGKTFFFTVTEQRRIAEDTGEESIQTPSLCHACRKQVPPSQAKPVKPVEHRVEPPQRVQERETVSAAEPKAQAEETFEPVLDDFPLEEQGIELKLIGTVKWFSMKKGYGFVTKADGEDVFFHRSDVVGRQAAQIRDDQRIEFQLRRTEKGLEAFNVSILPTA